MIDHRSFVHNLSSYEIKAQKLSKNVKMQINRLENFHANVLKCNKLRVT